MSTAAVTHSGWLHTIKNLQCIASNLCWEQANSGLVRGYTYLANLPLRLVNDFFALREGEYYKVAFDIAAFTALFFPYGRSTAVVIDYVSECVKIYRKSGSMGIHTAKNFQCIVSNVILASQKDVFPRQYTYLANLPLRLGNDFFALRNVDYVKLVFDIAAFAALFFPYGHSMAVLIDYLSEIAAADDATEVPPESRDAPSLQLPPNCAIRANALELLGLTEAEARNSRLLEQRYRERYDRWTQTIEGINAPEIKFRLEYWRGAVVLAYHTLQRPPPPSRTCQIL